MIAVQSPGQPHGCHAGLATAREGAEAKGLEPFYTMGSLETGKADVK